MVNIVFTAEKRAQFLEMLTCGISRRSIARALGLPPETVHRWYERGNQNVAAHEAFVGGTSKDPVELNESGKFVIEALAIEAKVERNYWEVVSEIALDPNGKAETKLKAAQWILQTRWPESYNKEAAVKSELMLKDGALVSVDAREVLAMRIEAMRTRDGKGRKPDIGTH